MLVLLAPGEPARALMNCGGRDSAGCHFIYGEKSRSARNLLRGARWGKEGSESGSGGCGLAFECQQGWKRCVVIAIRIVRDRPELQGFITENLSCYAIGQSCHSNSRLQQRFQLWPSLIRAFPNVNFEGKRSR